MPPGDGIPQQAAGRPKGTRIEQPTPKRACCDAE
jgi:hypothetical protein